jgi:hypothetical protein
MSDVATITCGECPAAAECPPCVDSPALFECPIDGEMFEADTPCKECMGFLHKMALVYEARLARGEKCE